MSGSTGSDTGELDDEVKAEEAVPPSPRRERRTWRRKMSGIADRNIDIVQRHLLGFYGEAHAKKLIFEGYDPKPEHLTELVNGIFDANKALLLKSKLTIKHLTKDEQALIDAEGVEQPYLILRHLPVDGDLAGHIEAMYRTLERDMHVNTYHTDVSHQASRLLMDQREITMLPISVEDSDRLSSRYLLAALSALQAGLDLASICNLTDRKAIEYGFVQVYNQLVDQLDEIDSSDLEHDKLIKEKKKLLSGLNSLIHNKLKSKVVDRTVVNLGIKWHQKKMTDVKKKGVKKHTLAVLRQFTRTHFGFNPVVVKRKGGVIEILRPIRTRKYSLSGSSPAWLAIYCGTKGKDLSMLPTQVDETLIGGSVLRNAWDVTLAKEVDGKYEVLTRYTRSGAISIGNDTDMARADRLVAHNLEKGFDTALTSLMSSAKGIKHPVSSLRKEFPRTEAMRKVASDMELPMNEAPIYGGGTYPDEVFSDVQEQFFADEAAAPTSSCGASKNGLGEFLRIDSNVKHIDNASWRLAFQSTHDYVKSLPDSSDKSHQELILAWKVLDINKKQGVGTIPIVIDALASSKIPYYFEWQQAIDIILAYQNGVAVNLQCKSGKDRTGLIALMVSMLVQHKAEFGTYFPLEVSEETLVNFDIACTHAAESGTSAFIAHYGGTSGCEGMMPKGGGTSLREMVCPSIIKHVEPQLSNFAQSYRAKMEVTGDSSSESEVTPPSSLEVDTDSELVGAGAGTGLRRRSVGPFHAAESLPREPASLALPGGTKP